MLEQANRASACSPDTTVPLIYSDDAAVNDLLHVSHMLGAAIEMLADTPREPMAASDLERVDSLVWVSQKMVAAAVVKIEERSSLPAAVSQTSSFTALLSEYRRAQERFEAASASCHALYGRSALPEVVVRSGKRREVDTKTGAITWTRWEFRSPAQIEQHFAKYPAWMHPHGAEGLRTEKDTLLAELGQLALLRREAEENCGLRAAYDAVSVAENEVIRLYADLTAHRPATALDVTAKSAFFLEVMQDTELDADEVATILRSFLTLTSPINPN